MFQFLVVANPRSRTRWLAEYLRCPHDLALGCSSVGEFANKLRNTHGSVETSVVIGLPLWRSLFPKMQLVLIHRTPFEVADSFERLRMRPDWMFLYMQDRALWFAADNDPNAVLYSFESLAKPSVRAELCARLSIPFDTDRDGELALKNIQVDMEERRRLVESNRENTVAFLDDMARGLARLEYAPL